MELMSARQVAAVPYYAAQGSECALFERAHASLNHVGGLIRDLDRKSVV